MAKAIIDSVSEVPDVLRSEYEERDGRFHLKIDGNPKGFAKSSDLADANSKIAEFRDTNTGLKKQLDQINSKFDGIDPDEYKKLRDRVEDLQKRGVGDGDDLSKAIQKAIASYHEKVVVPLQKSNEETTQREKDATAALHRKNLESMLAEEGLKAGVNEKALTDFLRRGLETWEWRDGKAVAHNGAAPLYSKAKPSDPLSIKEWVVELSNDAPHLFKPSKGGGGGPGSGGSGGQTTYDSNDDATFLENIDAIATGKMTARDTQ